MHSRSSENAGFPKLLTGNRISKIAALVFCGLVQGGSAVVTALFLRHILNSAANGSVQHHDLSAWLAYLLLIALIAAGSRCLERILAEQLGQGYVHELRLLMFDSLSRSAIRNSNMPTRGAISLRFTGDLTAIRQWISLGLSRIIVSGLMIFGVLGVLTYLSPIASGIIAILLILNFAISFAIGRRMEFHIEESRRTRAMLATNMVETVANIATVVGFGRTNKERKRLNKMSKKLIGSLQQRAFWAGCLRGLAELSARFATAAVMIVGIAAMITAKASPADLVAMLAVVGLMLTPIRDLGRVYEYRKNANVSHRKIAHFLTQAPPIAEHRSVKIGSGKGILKLDNVALRGSLENFSVRVKTGSIIAIRGSNGAGKTTLLWTMAGLIEPEIGTVCFNGVPTYSLTAGSLRRSIGIASTDLPLMRGSISKNVRYRIPGATMEAVILACEKVGLANTISGFNKGYATRVREDGRNLSDGQRVRLKLARAILGEPKLLLLDEIDGCLDADGKRDLQSLIKHYPGTVVFTTHDKSMLSFADEVWSFVDGKIRINDGLANKISPLNESLKDVVKVTL